MNSFQFLGAQAAPVIAFVHKFLKSKSGATAIEYSVVGGGIALLLIAGSGHIKEGIESSFYKAAAGFEKIEKGSNNYKEITVKEIE